VIEDWGWAHWPEYVVPDSKWAFERRSLADLFRELVSLIGSSPTVARVQIHRGFAAVECGDVEIGHEPMSFDAEIRHGIRPTWVHRGRRATRRAASRAQASPSWLAGPWGR
jgi:hypothetical protein